MNVISVNGICVWLVFMRLIHSTMYMCEHISICSFSSHANITNNLSIVKVIDLWIVFSLSLLWIKLLWKFLYVSLDTQRCVFLLDINPGMELLACSLYVCSAWVAALKQFSKIYTCTVRIWELQLLHMLQYILLFSYH